MIVLLVIAGFSYADDVDVKSMMREAESIDADYQDIDSVSPGSTLAEYLAFAEKNNPEIRATFYNWLASLRTIPQAGAYPDPVLSYGYFIENVETRVGPQEQRIGLRQSLPWFGTLKSKGKIAAHLAGSAYHNYMSARLSVFYKIKKAYYEYYYLARELTINKENFELLKQWESVATAGYKGGKAMYADLVKAQVELGILEDNIKTLTEKIVPVAAQLKSVLNLPDDTELPMPESIELKEIRFEDDTIINDILKNNPGIKSIESIVEKEKESVSLAGKKSYPNFTLGFDYIQTGEALNPGLDESGKDAWMITAGINLPIWFGKNKAVKNEAKARFRSSQDRLVNAQNELRAYAEQILFEYKDSQRKIDLYHNGLIQKAEQALNAVYTAYRSSQADFLSVIDAQRQLLNFQLALEKSRVINATGLAKIEMLTGYEINEKQ